MSEDLLDRPLRDLLATYDDGVDGEPLDLQEAFEFWGMVHPAEAGSAIRHIDMGIEREGFTAQGNAHPDYQQVIRQVTREPFGRDGSAPEDDRNVPNLTLVLETVAGETRRLRIRPHPDRHVAALLREDRREDEEWDHKGAEQLRRIAIEELGVEFAGETTEVGP